MAQIVRHNQRLAREDTLRNAAIPAVAVGLAALLYFARRRSERGNP